MRYSKQTKDMNALFIIYTTKKKENENTSDSDFEKSF